MPPSLTRFSSTVKPEGAFTVLAAARRVAAAGKDVIELEIGDSPFASPESAVEAGVEAIRAGRTTYGPSGGLPELRAAAAAYVNEEHGLSVTADHVIAGPGAKTFEQLFCDAFVEPDDGVLVFSPYFPTYAANIGRRGARMVLSNLRASRAFRPDLDDVRRFLEDDPRPKAIFLNSPHNPTGGSRPRTTCAGSPTSSGAATWRCSPTSPTTAWCGRAGTARCSPSPACSSRPSPPTRSASRSA